MTPVTIPWTDVNSETALVVAWHVDDRQAVTAGASLLDVETSKAALEIEAPMDGYLLQVASAGSTVSVGEPVGYLFEDEGALAQFAADRERSAQQASAAVVGEEPGAGRATAKAMERAAQLGVDIASIRAEGLITVKDVEAAAGQATTARPPAELPAPLTGDPTAQRLLLIGSGLGATQVIDILAERPGQQAVAIVDDNAAFWGREIRGVPVVGGSQSIPTLHSADAFDAAVITISTSVEARARLRRACEAAGVPLANVIDPSSKVGTGVVMGSGNVICAFCQLGTETRLGDNNFISAYNSFEHHNVIGSDISTGPGCMTSGEVHIGDRVRLGAGIFVEPKLTLGDDVQVASGAIIVRSVPAGHAVKTKVVTTTVVPIRGGPADTRT